MSAAVLPRWIGSMAINAAEGTYECYRGNELWLLPIALIGKVYSASLQCLP